jgi:hypothetical protein
LIREIIERLPEIRVELVVRSRDRRGGEGIERLQARGVRGRRNGGVDALRIGDRVVVEGVEQIALREELEAEDAAAEADGEIGGEDVVGAELAAIADEVDAVRNGGVPRVRRRVLHLVAFAREP